MTKTLRLWAVLLSLLFLLAACGQKSGVALKSDGSGGTGAAVGTGGGDDLGGGEVVGGEVVGGGEVAPGTDTGAGGTPVAGGGTGGGAPASGGGSAAPSGGTPAGATKPGATAAAADRTGITDKEIVIGIHAPVTGAAPIDQDSFESGVGVYWDFVKKKGGILNGRNVRVVFRDDQFSPVRARQVCTEMVEKEKVFLLVGGAGADQITACAQYANSVGVPYISAGVNTNGLEALKTYFAISQTYAQQSTLLAQLVKNNLKKTAVSMITMETPSFVDARASAKKAFQAAGIAIKADETISKNASSSEAQAKSQKLKEAGADVVYVLTSPTIFLNLAAGGQSQNFVPQYVGPGITNGLNLVATAGCPAIGAAKFLSPFPQLDAIDALDPDFRPAYRAKTGEDPDDIGIILWGVNKTLRVMFDATGPQISRQSYMATLESGKQFSTNVFPDSKFSPQSHFGGLSSHLLSADCVARQYKTAARFATSF
ncbi:MAG TPA: ABC transporter substrate-binding protein [Nonomuraea sp.]|nr:ABC transporter substrate-binding protein [Nonomuraea sp.]